MSFYTKIKPVSLQKAFSARYFPPFIPGAEQRITMITDPEKVRRAVTGEDEFKAVVKPKTLDSILKSCTPRHKPRHTRTYNHGFCPGNVLSSIARKLYPKGAKLVL